MAHDDLDSSRRALETAFYREGSDAFRESLAAEQVRARGALALATGISDEKLLTRLAELGIRPETLAALTLIPLIEAAWADGVLDDKEREAVLSGAASSGIAPGSASYGLLELWTLERPAPDLVALWREFIAALGRSLTDAERTRLRERVIGRARDVAAAAGGLLDATPNVSAEEQAVLDDLGGAF